MARPRVVAVVIATPCLVVGAHHCTAAPRGAGAPCGHGHHVQVVSCGYHVWAVSCGHGGPVVVVMGAQLCWPGGSGRDATRHMEQ